MLMNELAAYHSGRLQSSRHERGIGDADTVNGDQEIAWGLPRHCSVDAVAAASTNARITCIKWED
jgi:hypothetical protein